MAAQLAFLLQSKIDESVDQESLRAALLADHADLDPAKLTHQPSDGAEDEALVLDYDGTMIALMSVPEAIGDDLAEIAAHSRLWPRDQPVPTDYGAHTITSVFRADADGHEASIEQAVLLSRVVATLVGLSDTVRAVFWGAANHAIFPPVFRDLALSALPNPLLPAWVAINVGSRPDGAMTGHTLGLDGLGVMDIEIPETTESADTVFERLSSIADYQLESGPVIGDGHTIGETADAQIVARHTPSALGDDRTVLTLEFMSTAPPKKRGWFGRR